MGLTKNIQNRELPIAVAKATEGLRGRLDGLAIGLVGLHERAGDVSKVLFALDRIAARTPHLVDWSFTAYASASWDIHPHQQRLALSVLFDWMLVQTEQGNNVQSRTYERMQVLTPIVINELAGGLLRMATYGGASSSVQRPGMDSKKIIDCLVQWDKDKYCLCPAKRKRYYQNYWQDWKLNIDGLVSILLDYDQAARIKFRKEIEKQNITD